MSPTTIPNGITLKMLIHIVLIISIVMLLATSKIYLSTQIYYNSKKINHIRSEVQALKAEKVMLEKKVEALMFKTKVADTIFTIYGDD